MTTASAAMPASRLASISPSAMRRETCCVASAMHPLSPRIERGLANSHLREPARRRRVEPPADAGPPASTSASAIERSAVGAPVARGDVAQHAHRRRLRPGSATICAPSSSNDASVVGQEADELLAPRRDRVRPRQRPTPTKSASDLATTPRGPTSSRRDRAVGLLADDDEALLSAQHVHRLGAVGRDAEALARARSQASHTASP